ncbi:hypothetical protein FQR65_LT18378 [Abscondita terminalis]|nr:hypothetical protein FQR65_LT18378 [Abscondita terminalis]
MSNSVFHWEYLVRTTIVCAKIWHDRQGTVSIRCTNMAGFIDDNLNEQSMEIILEFLSSSSSDDDDDLLLSERRIIPKIQNFLEVVHNFSENEFKCNFRVCRMTAFQIINMFKNSEFYPSIRSHGGIETTSPELHVLSFLW